MSVSLWSIMQNNNRHVFYMGDTKCNKVYPGGSHNFGETEALQCFWTSICTSTIIRDHKNEKRNNSLNKYSIIKQQCLHNSCFLWLHPNIVIGENPISQMASRYKLHKSKKFGSLLGYFEDWNIFYILYLWALLLQTMQSLLLEN